MTLMNSSLKRLFSALCAVLFLGLLLGLAHDNASPTVHGVSTTDMDASVRPGDDFYSYANGGWIKRTEIPPDRPGVGVFTRLGDVATERTKGLIDEAAESKPPAGSSARQIADLYNSFMNEAAIESRGVAPLKPHLAAIASIKTKQQLARALGKTLRADVDALNNTNFHTPNLFGLWTAPGFGDSDHYAAYLLQGGLELPDREYYLADTPHMREVRTQYQAHIAAMLKLAGFSNAESRATAIFQLEHSIAEKHQSLADNNEIHKANNTWKRSDFSAKAPGLDWTEYFRAAGLEKQQQFTVWQPSAFSAESALVDSVPLETWKDWLSYHLIEDYAPYLPKSFADERFNFFGKTLFGTPEQLPRWRRGVFLVNASLGDAVGKNYAQRYFSPQAKAEAQEMVANIIAAFRKRIDALDWMAPSTKAEAEAKLNTLYVGIGYPETWHDYSGYDVKADDIFGNVWRAELFEYHRQVTRLGSSVDRHEWSMSPQTVNAVNLPLQNALNFPAAILQPPFFDPQAPLAVNYGAIGAVIGHEISHTFDSEGAAFDDKGRVRNWWTPADLSHFNTATAQLAAQYDSYKPFPDLSVNGKQTLPEDIADLAGVAAAYDAYRTAIAGKSAPEQNGFTPDQQFFIAFGQDWGAKVRDAALRRQILTDSHAPGRYRASTVRNIDAWYTAFNVTPEEKLYLAPSERVRIW
jgi:putative endopeptidase